MSLATELHAARQQRLARLGAIPPKPSLAPILQLRKPPKPVAFDAGWDGMWFWDLVHGHSKEPRTILVRDIQEAVCKHFGMTLLDLLSSRRTADVAYPRHIAFYICREMTKHGFAELGRRFGGRDHTTVIHGDQRIRGMYGFDMRVTCDVNAVRKLLA